MRFAGQLPRPRIVHTSVVKKSAAKMDLACAFRKVFHGVRRPRSGAGWIPLRSRMALIVFGQTMCPRFLSAPWRRS